ncbi:von Willebrand factor type A [Nonlabens sp. MIC269]|uniref:vWA domain-containing protein n=1 Tax=Nonlabens sp. MIC269 TaxID=1476901 RepID=UPI00072289DC|nr:vWA domain-containing protein [Nonlabens sp. MIC269]ALM20922.1 von Willebrand factor type A [Nonlabens sp. MIC269]
MKKKILMLGLALISIACNAEKKETEVRLSINQQAPIDQSVDRSKKATIQIALLLDTSNSMDGLINQAKSQLWDVVNKMTSAHCNDQQAGLEIALYEYGNSGLSEKDDYIRQVLPFSTDLDMLSKELFALRTNGGDEYCGAVIDNSIKKLEWRDGKQDLKMIFIAGNEGFTQGTISFKESIIDAQKKDITVNTIFCGEYQTGINLKWKEGASLGNGEYTNIDANKRTVYVATPYDDKILELNNQLNSTYIAYGDYGNQKQKLQIEMDVEAMVVSEEVQVKRSVAKSSSNYQNASWDLVDNAGDDKLLKKIIKENKSTLPDSLKNKSVDEVAAFAKAELKTRKQLQNQIAGLNIKREKYISEQNMTEGNGLETAIFKVIQKQAEKKSYTWK